MDAVGQVSWELAWTAVFWACAALLTYVYLGYPAFAWARAALAKERPARVATEPSVTVIVVAHNEADRMEARLDNLLAQDYPRDRLSIVVASDGSTDRTVEIAQRYAPDRVRVIAFEMRRGKTAVLNDVVPKAEGDIVVFADARQRFAPDTVRALVRPFADPRVGAVSGELILTSGPEETGVGRGVGLYWRYEKLIRRSESRVDSTVGATGAVYAIRRRLYEPVPDDTILDDVLIPLRIIRRGYRVLFESEALAYDRVAADASHEFTRKVRTLAGNFQLFRRETWLLDPRANRLWLATMSHKGLRLLSPLLHVGLFVSSVALAGGDLYALALAGQYVFYAAALIGRLLARAGRRSAICSVPYVLCLLNWATVVGFFRFVTGRQTARWDRPPA